MATTMKRPILSSLRVRLLFLVLVGLLPVLVMVTYFGKEQRDRTLSDQRARVLHLAKNTALRFDNLVGEGRGILTALAQIPQVRDLDPAVADSIMANLLEMNKEYTAIFGLDRHGNRAVEAPRSAKPDNYADRDWFRRVRETRSFTTTDFEVGRVSGKARLALCYPILNARGEFQGALVASISLDWLDRFFHRIDLPPGTHGFILDRAGAVLASYGPQDIEAGHRRPDHPLVRAALAQGETVAEVASFSGQPFLFAITPLGDTGAKVVVGFSMESILSPSRRDLHMQLILLGVLTALGLAAAWIAGDRLVRRPVDRLLEVTARVGAGDLEANYEGPYPAGELGQLAQGLDGMTADLKRLTAARARQELMEHLQHLVAHTDAVLYTRSPEGDFRATFISDNLTEVLGYEPREFLEDPGFWLNHIHPEDRERVLGAIPHFLEQGHIFHEYRFRHQDGSCRWLHDEVRLLQDEAGRPTELVGYCVDITARKETEATLSKLARQHQVILETLGEGVFGLDLNGDHTFVNPAAAKMLGYEVKELIGRHSHSTWHYGKPDGSPYPEAECPIYATLRNGSVQHDLTEVFWRKDGISIPVEVTTRPIQEEGKTVGAVASFRDISKRKQAEEALHRIEWMLSMKHPSSYGEEHRDVTEDQGYGDLTELNRDGIIRKSIAKDILGDIVGDYLNLLETSGAVYEKNGDYAYGIFSFQWCRLMDRASRELCGTEDNVEALSSGKWLCHESCWTCASKEAIASRAPVDIECQGGIRLYALPIFAGDEVIGSINLGYGDPPQDPAKVREIAKLYKLDDAALMRQAKSYNSRPGFIISLAKSRLEVSAKLIGVLVERHRAELQLRTLSQNLATSLRKTQEAQCQAEIAGQVKSLFLANVSHELRTPLNAVTGFSQVLKDELYGPLNPKQRQYVDQIGEGAARLTAIISRMLDMAQLSAGEVALTLTRMPLQDLLRLSLALFPDLAARRHIALSLELGPGAEGLLEVDPGKFQQIMVNLLENAVKFTPEGGAVTVTGGLPAALPPGLAGAPEDWAQVSVKDTGIGINPQDLDRLFQNFVQLEAPLTKTYAGVGLGLAQTRRLVELHGGRIWVESQPGQGSVFIFILPVQHDQEKEQVHG